MRTGEKYHTFRVDFRTPAIQAELVILLSDNTATDSRHTIKHLYCEIGATRQLHEHYESPQHERGPPLLLSNNHTLLPQNVYYFTTYICRVVLDE